MIARMHDPEMASPITLSITASPTTSSTTSTSILDIRCLSEVMAVLRRHKYSGKTFYELGLYLGLSDSTLQVIGADHKGNTHRCLLECLRAWLRKTDEVENPTWVSLRTAFKQLEENAVADGIESDKLPASCIILSQRHKALVWSINHPFDIAESLHREGVLSIESLTIIQSTRGSVKERTEALLSLVYQAVSVDHKYLETFVSILRTHPNTVQLADDILWNYNEQYIDSSKVELMSDDVPSPKIKQAALSEDKSILIPRSWSSEFAKMRTEFAGMFFKARRAITKHFSRSVKDLKDYLEDFYRHLSPRLSNARKIHDILSIIRECCTLINITILEAILQEFGINGVEDQIKNYKQSIATFCESVRARFCFGETFQVVDGPTPLKCETATFILNWDADEFTVADVSDVIGEALGKDSNVKIRVIVETNSIQVVCSFPVSSTGILIARALDNLDVLKELKLLKLTIGYCTVYDYQKENEATSVSDEHDDVNEYAYVKLMKKVVQLEPSSETSPFDSYVQVNGSKPSTSHKDNKVTNITTEDEGVFSTKDDANKTDVEVRKEDVTGSSTNEDIQPTSDAVEVPSSHPLSHPFNTTYGAPPGCKLSSSVYAGYLIEQHELLYEREGSDFMPKVFKKDSDDEFMNWRGYLLLGSVDVMIIGSNGNKDNFWGGKSVVLPKIIPKKLRRVNEKEVDMIQAIYQKNPDRYCIRHIYEDLPGEEKSREHYLEGIKAFFINSTRPGGALIYYTGHGEKGTGNWCFRDGAISFCDIFNLYKEVFRGDPLTIVSDCSYSGNWINECAKVLDEMNIPSCGHHTRYQNVLLKIYTSCRHDEEATAFTYIKEAVTYSPIYTRVFLNYSTMYLYESKNTVTLSSGQSTMFTDFKIIRCSKSATEPCELDYTHTWSDRLSNKIHRIHIVCGKDGDIPVWWYLLVDEDKLDWFKLGCKLTATSINSCGRILYSGEGDFPPESITRKVAMQFMKYI